MSPSGKTTRETFTLKQLVNPTEAQLRRAGRLTYELMSKDPALISLCGGDPDLMEPLGLAMVRAGALEGEFYAAVDGSDDILGFVMTMPKGKVLFSTEEQKKLGFYDFMSRLSEAGKRYYADTYLKIFPQYVASCIAPLTMVDIWWIHTCMTRVESQGQGIASGLIRMILDKALAAGDVIGLSTTTEVNVRIYESMGFKVIGHRGCPSPWGDWEFWVLRYEPTQS
ncbi:hypothetical protein BXZ70DRAFT_1006941 [Cristinia sonorae]|uniref:N-acetyltransferase domain-containing protein n=1 Tax=Cristinia sonorae TaxID=1940300 RepID=A0A8K0URC8_9AGAR|nr:hypothetical protein BXZ70DRAFT_1006941 [Cristinia sonorae]